ncbi:MAG: MTH938/NDUFAF3 family protein [Hyphomicrobiales bacterium]|nr:MTH938/NDUFAF3 family protein [Hyphomicrobiales bacterium]
MSEDRVVGRLPTPAPIESWGAGGFRFADMSHRGSLLCLPSGMAAWDPGVPPVFDETTLAPLFAEAAAIDICLLGTGRTLVPLSESLRWRFRDARISVEAMATGHALRTWNILLGERRRVAAALLAVD